MSLSVSLDKPRIGSLDSIQSDAIGFESQTALVRRLIWLYMVLWLIEGSLRRWFLPSLASPLLLIRDPLVLVIYFCAFAKRVFPINFFIYSGALLAILTFANALLIGHGNPLVALYGVRCDFLHVPLILIMGQVIRRKDLIALARIALLIAIPYTLLLIAQFYAPQDAWVNRGIGGSLEGAGFSGALNRFRPPGTFSFISGPSQLYPIFTACWFGLALIRKLPSWLAIASAMAILVTIPVSVSRGLFLSVLLVAVLGVGALFISGRFSTEMIIRIAVAGIILPVLAQKTPAFRDGMEAFQARWESSTTDNGGFQEAIVDRVLNDLFGVFKIPEHSCLGTGFSTNVGQKVLTGEPGFGASEAEWGRLLYDNGYLLGSLLILYRVALAASIVYAAFRGWRQGAPMGVVFAAAGFLLLFDGEWGQSTTLGSAIICGGLTLAASKAYENDDFNTRLLRDPAKTFGQ
ncbi:MAG TPA: hypothetical protein VH595_06235 [Verrucomicrobiae bacterium]|jgi:hypothetical protein|nr:hypothetical protein [Verrucomicrobiae bacterium]